MGAAAEIPWTERGVKREFRHNSTESLEAVGRLAGGVAHDFNNLLTGVLLNCDLLLTVLETDHRARKYAEEIRSASLQGAGLIKQLMGLVRPAGNDSCLLSINQTAEGMRNLLVRLIGEHIDLNFQLDPNLGWIRMNPSEAQQILLNLVLNARDAMPGGGEITIETGKSRLQILAECGIAASEIPSLPYATLVVRDNGSGMDAATQAHIFEAFFTTKAGKGTGLGLATVHDIVTSNGGLIHVDSAPACGTRVTLLLPLVPEAVLNRTDQCLREDDEGELSRRNTNTTGVKP